MVELGWLAKDQGIVNLEELVKKLFDCGVDKNGTIILSDWSKQDVSKQQIQYAAIDVYAHMFCYLKLLSMPFLDPKKVKAPKMIKLKNGESVLLYTKNHQTVVAGAVFVAGQSTKIYLARQQALHPLPLFVSPAKVFVYYWLSFCERGSMSLALLLQEDVAEQEATGSIKIPWTLVKDLQE